MEAGMVRKKKKQGRAVPKQPEKKKGYFLFDTIGFLFVFCYLTEKKLAETGNIDWTASYTLKTLGSSLACGILLGSVCAYFCYAQCAAPARNPAKGKVGGEAKSFAIKLLVIGLSWLPVFLAYYPGICAYDAPSQTGQAYENYYIDHHPIVHTLLIKAAMTFGSKVWGEANAGIALYTLCQMLLLAGAMSYALVLLRRFGVRKGWQRAAQLLCMLYPFHWYMSVSMTKDTVFSAFFLLQLLSLTVLLQENKNTLKGGKTDLLFFVSTVGMILFRNNGKYAVCVPLVLLVFMAGWGKAARRLWGRLLVSLFAALVTGTVLLSAVFTATGAEQGDRREMLSMPIQQLARCMLYHGGVGVLPEDDNTLTAEEKALISDFLLDEAYKLYNPAISDPVKAHTNTYVVRYRTVTFVKIYLQLLWKYPGDFINAALAVNAGFLSPADTSHAYINVTEGLEHMGYVQTRWDEETLRSRGIYPASKLPALQERLEKWAEENGYLRLPVLKYLFVPGSFLWLYLLLAGYLIIQGKYRYCLPLSLVGGYYLTMFLGPTVQLRYMYPVMLAFPFLVLLAGRKR